MSIEERLALLKELRTVKPGSARAQQILRSLQIYQPRVHGTQGHIRLNNPVIGVNVTAQNSRNPQKIPGYNVGFTTKTGIERPLKANSIVDLLGIKTAVSQTVDKIPPGGNYFFEPIGDEGGFGRKNQRGLSYDRFTRGAFTAHPTAYGRAGQGTRLSQNRWRPLDAAGNPAQTALWNPGRREIKNLAKKAATTVTRRVFAANPYVQGALTVDDIVEAYTGKGLMERFVNLTDEALDKGTVQRPATLIMPR